MDSILLNFLQIRWNRPRGLPPIASHNFEIWIFVRAGGHPDVRLGRKHDCATRSGRVGAIKSGRHTFYYIFGRFPPVTITIIQMILRRSGWREWRFAKKACSQASTVAEWVDFPRRFFPGRCHEKLLNEAARLALPERKVETLQWVKERRRLSLPLRNAALYPSRTPPMPLFFFFPFLRRFLSLPSSGSPPVCRKRSRLLSMSNRRDPNAAPPFFEKFSKILKL